VIQRCVGQCHDKIRRLREHSDALAPLLQRIRQQDQTAFAHYDLMLVTLKSGDANEADMRAVKNIDIFREASKR
jgi:hypothetical protein